MLTTQNGPTAAGVQDAAAGVDPNAPVQQPRRCGTCVHFDRFEPGTGDLVRAQRFGRCARTATVASLAAADPASVPALGGLPTVGDEFGCAFFVANLNP